MDPIKFVKESTDLSFGMLNLANRIRYILEYRKYKDTIHKNSVLKNRHNGETCYIIGNGPSLKNMDLSELENKNTFMVNGSISTNLFDIVKPKYFCVYDRSILEQLHDSLINRVIENKYKTQFIFNRSAFKDFGNFKNVNFIYSTLLPIKGNIKFDLTKNANVFINVVPFAIMCAIYMGFKKIVILGCDFSFFAHRKESHFYDIDKNKERKENLYQDLLGCSIAWQQYNSLYSFSKKMNIEIVNATPNSLLDVFPQVKLEDYL